ERGKLAARIPIRVGRPSILGAHQVHVLGRDRESLLGEEHAQRPRVRPERVVDEHGGLPPVREADLRSTRGGLQAASARDRDSARSPRTLNVRGHATHELPSVAARVAARAALTRTGRTSYPRLILRKNHREIVTGLRERGEGGGSAARPALNSARSAPSRAQDGSHGEGRDGCVSSEEGVTVSETPFPPPLESYPPIAG